MRGVLRRKRAAVAEMRLGTAPRSLIQEGLPVHAQVSVFNGGRPTDSGVRNR